MPRFVAFPVVISLLMRSHGDVVTCGVTCQRIASTACARDPICDRVVYHLGGNDYRFHGRSMKIFRIDKILFL